MKIGLLTFHCVRNYGAVLQCYATREFLKSKGYNVEVINYCPNYLMESYPLFNKKRLVHCSLLGTIVNFIKELIHFPRRCYQKWAFHSFLNRYLNLSHKVYATTIPSDFDAYIVGSDQIWNSRITKGFDRNYFCEFPFLKGGKRYIAYAASMGSVAIDTEETATFLREALNKFDAISVREYSLQQTLQSLTSLSIAHVLDPTLMVDSQIWENIPSSNSSKTKYVVVYQVRHNQNTMRIAKDIAKQMGAKVLVLDTWFSLSRGVSYRSVSLEGFVDAIRNAACVVTTSFHGTAFSIIFNKPFYVVKLDDGGDERSQSLLEALGLEDRLINMDSSPIFSPINYSEANTRLKELRESSQEFLLNALK